MTREEEFYTLLCEVAGAATKAARQRYKELGVYEKVGSDAGHLDRLIFMKMALQGAAKKAEGDFRSYIAKPYTDEEFMEFLRGEREAPRRMTDDQMTMYEGKILYEGGDVYEKRFNTGTE